MYPMSDAVYTHWLYRRYNYEWTNHPLDLEIYARYNQHARRAIREHAKYLRRMNLARF